jgi:Putative beta-barrel porin 2
MAMNKVAILAIIGVSFCASGVRAADVSIKGNATETLEASDNYFLLNAPSGSTYKSTTAGTLDVLALTPSTSYLLDTNYSYYKFFGPGAVDTEPTWGTPASATFTINHATKLDLFNFAASWTRSDAQTTQFQQTGFATARGSINTYAVNGGVTHDLGRIDSITWTAQASKVSFTDPNQFPSVDVTTTAAWKHDVSPTTTLNNLVSFDWFSEDDPAQSQRLFWKFMTGLDSKLSPRLTFTGHVGIGFVNSYQTASVQTIIPPGPPGVAPFVPQVGTANSILADATLTYQLFKTTRVSLTAAQAVFPTTFGQLQKSDTIGLSLTHDINHLSNLSFAANFSFVPATQGNSAFGGQSGDSDFFSASVNYGYNLTREWRTNLSYTYRERNDDTGIARSSTILFALSRDFTLLGNPTAINQAQQERAKQRAQQTVGYVFPGFH